ncbi:Ni-sirohydrochlorin a,c-diamide synthase [Methanonatronarchaeum sp. AMET-Sl]|uniref:Ni-sirohydrochlorin a,c-diamide synthase n=1 Tax=Methanonatronarchaeum sp. AMET-Sl TaxID=3037654 RepID=UPI00244DA6A4|nr:Ni-sirohydrochlorin a,c-diamide synthase [Methanonatronarchaeum sp. AMET-Sl]WGI16873.1 Ni-sirohydrochlorin a,c-diamide synthase [Methanonatronarchaeum sp. AMET-Sl]
MQTPCILLSADRSSAGKTTIATGIMAALTQKGLKVQGFKAGLDYIDTTYHEYATGRPSRNLDGYVMTKKNIQNIYQNATQDADIAVIEGVRGLYEGIDIETDTGSTYQISKTLNTPIILIMDVTSITKSAAAILNGIKTFKNANIQGVILNKVGSQKHRKKLKKAINKHTDIQIVGIIPRNKKMEIPYRHLGLIPATEMQNKTIKKHNKQLQQTIQQTINLQKIQKIAKPPTTKTTKPTTITEPTKPTIPKTGIKVGVALDKAFTFYYHENLEILKQYGAEIKYFSPIKDELPNVDGLYIGGGYPEIYAEQLEQNQKIRQQIKTKSQQGMPIYGECGGLLYLLNKIEYQNQEYKMTGALKGKGIVGENRVVGYTKIKTTKNNPLHQNQKTIKAHEFHHSEIKQLKNPKYSYKLHRGTGIQNQKDGLTKNNTIGTYQHIHLTPYPEIAKNFLKKCKKHKNKH